jgi:hypothetical protein
MTRNEKQAIGIYPDKFVINRKIKRNMIKNKVGSNKIKKIWGIAQTNLEESQIDKISKVLAENKLLKPKPDDLLLIVEGENYRKSFREISEMFNVNKSAVIRISKIGT